MVIATSAKDVMFLVQFVCLSLSRIKVKTTGLIFIELVERCSKRQGRSES